METWSIDFNGPIKSERGNLATKKLSLGFFTKQNERNETNDGWRHLRRALRAPSRRFPRSFVSFDSFRFVKTFNFLVARLPRSLFFGPWSAWPRQHWVSWQAHFRSGFLPRTYHTSPNYYEPSHQAQQKESASTYLNHGAVHVVTTFHCHTTIVSFPLSSWFLQQSWWQALLWLDWGVR